MNNYQCPRCLFEQLSGATGYVSCPECRKDGNIVPMRLVGDLKRFGLVVRGRMWMARMSDRITGKEASALKAKHASEMYEQKCEYDKLQNWATELQADGGVLRTDAVQFNRIINAQAVELTRVRADFAEWRDACESAAHWASKWKDCAIKWEDHAKKLQSTISNLRGQITKLKNKAKREASARIEEGEHNG